VFVALNFSDRPAEPVIDRASAPVMLAGAGAPEIIWGAPQIEGWGALVARWGR